METYKPREDGNLEQYIKGLEKENAELKQRIKGLESEKRNLEQRLKETDGHLYVELKRNLEIRKELVKLCRNMF